MRNGIKGIVINVLSVAMAASAVALVVANAEMISTKAQGGWKFFFGGTKAETETTTAMSDTQTQENDTTTQKNSDIVFNNVEYGKLNETLEATDDYFENIMFLGDSRTDALAAYNLIPSYNTFAVQGINHVDYMSHTFTDALTGVTGNIFTILQNRQPKIVYIALGVNGVGFMDDKTFVEKFEMLVDKVIEATPNSKIIIQAILPVEEEHFTYTGKLLTNEAIDYMNTNLLDIASSRKLFYIDFTALMKDADNDLSSEYDSSDGLHYNFKGYELVVKQIKKHAIDVE